MHETDRAWISIDKENLLHNVKELRRLSGAGCALMPAVKANAYGHGDVPYPPGCGDPRLLCGVCG